MMRRIASGFVVSMMIVGAADGASLFLRVAGADGQAEVTANLGESVTLEIVVVLAEGEEIEFAGLFLDTDTSDDAEIIEALDFIPGLDPPADYSGGHGVSSGGNEFPFDAGSGVSLEQYQLNMQTGGEAIPTGTAVVLEQITLNSLSAGTVAISVEVGSRPPSFFTPAPITPFQIATADVPADLPGFLYLGVGDSREGGVGALMLTIIDDGGVGNDNDNVADNVNDNGATANENLNDIGRNEGPRATGGTNICGFGLVGPMLTCAGLLALSAGRRRR